MEKAIRDLSKMSAAELVDLYNARCPETDRIEAPWKRSKPEIIERIRALDVADANEAEVSDAELEATERITVRALAEALVAAADGVPLTYEQIADRIREDLPGSAPTAQSVRWYASKMRKRGEAVRVRHVSRKPATD